jgi:hypothetical protein
VTATNDLNTTLRANITNHSTLISGNATNQTDAVSNILATARINSTNDLNTTLRTVVTNHVALATNGTVAKAVAATHATNFWGQLNVSNYNNGTAASSSTYLRGDGTWVAPSGTGDAVKANNNDWSGSNYFGGSTRFGGQVYGGDKGKWIAAAGGTPFAEMDSVFYSGITNLSRIRARNSWHLVKNGTSSFGAYGATPSLALWSGTLTGVSPTSTVMDHGLWYTGATANNETGAYANATTHNTGTNFFIWSIVAITNVSSVRAFVCAYNFTVSSDTPTSDGVGFRFSTAAGDTKWIAYSGDGIAAQTTDSGVTVTAESFYDVAILKTNGTVVFWINGTQVASHSTRVPDNFEATSWRSLVRTLENAAKGIRIIGMGGWTSTY